MTQHRGQNTGQDINNKLLLHNSNNSAHLLNIFTTPQNHYYLSIRKLQNSTMASKNVDQKSDFSTSILRLKHLILSDDDDRATIAHFQAYRRLGGHPTKEMYEKYLAAIENQQAECSISINRPHEQNNNINSVFITAQAEGATSHGPIHITSHPGKDTTDQCTEPPASSNIVWDIGCKAKDAVVFVASGVAKLFWLTK
ncbi:uncharacterized protein LY89DRAFT_239356 [Mollisia scopiformis]|uniref:Uncharacterized protein n=1 Tax=Mollisia scopiformis TaxID=149040 RepID=A0A194WU37_MOLSC|nr:uncharacterized protein LY89DRAFT_239356 [Mollisia scopiformis]KUJ11194.1 hypothetical protein LY89DRAFT_239356 [Mollisia scopiformis]